MVDVPKAIGPATAVLVLACSLAALSDPLPPDATYRPLPTLPFSAVKTADEAQKPQVMQRQTDLLNERYDLSDRPIPGVMMSGGRKPVQAGVRVKLPAGATWDSLSQMGTLKLLARSRADWQAEGNMLDQSSGRGSNPADVGPRPERSRPCGAILAGGDVVA